MASSGEGELRLDELRQAVINLAFTPDEQKSDNAIKFMEILDFYIARSNQQAVQKARIDELLGMRAVGDAYAASRHASFEGLSDAYDKHILKRLADLMGPELDV